jgi:hypothetical protein
MEIYGTHKTYKAPEEERNLSQEKGDYNRKYRVRLQEIEQEEEEEMLRIIAEKMA